MKKVLNTILKKVILLLFFILLPFTSVSQVDSSFIHKSLVRVGYYENEVFQEGASPASVKSGYAYEYYRKLSEYTGWKYEYIYGEYNDLYKMLCDGTIDLLAGIASREDRLKDILYPSLPMGSTTYSLLRKNDDLTISSDPLSFNDKKIGVLKSAMVDILEEWINKNSLSSRIVIYYTYHDLYKGFDRGEVDSILVEGNGSQLRNDAVSVLTAGNSDYYLCVNKKRQDILSELNKAQYMISIDNPMYFTRLHYKYFPNSISSRSFSQNEIEWLNKHSSITVGYVGSYLPYSARGKDGNPEGLVKDISEIIIKKLGLEDRLKVNYKWYKNYDDMISGFSLGETDVVFPVNCGLYYSEVIGLYQTSPVLNSNVDLIYKGAFPEKRDVVIAVRKGNSMHDFFVREGFPDAEVLYCNGLKDCFNAVKKGRADFTVLNGMVTPNVLKQSRFRTLKSRAYSKNEDICFGVHTGDESLLMLFNRGLNSIGTHTVMDKAYHHADKLYTYTSMDYFRDNILVFFSSLFGIIGLILALIYRDIHKKHKYLNALEKSNQEKQLQLKIITDLNRDLSHKQVLLEEAMADQESQLEEISSLYENLKKSDTRISVARNVIEGLSRDYMTIWIIDYNTLKMTLIKDNVNDDNVLRDAVDFAKDKVDYNVIYKNYVNTWIHKDDRERVMKEASPEQVISHIKDQKCFYYINYRRVINGKINYNQLVYIDASSGQNSSHFVLGFRNVDVTVQDEIKRSQELERLNHELEKQAVLEKLQIKTIAESIHGGFKTSKNDGVFSHLYVSEQLAQMVGYTVDEFMKASSGSMAGIANLEDARRELPKAFESVGRGEMYTMNYRMKCKDGSWKNIEDRGRLISIPGKDDEFWSFLIDKDEMIQKSKALEEAEKANKALKETKKKLEKASKAKSNFLFNMSHDIRTPMNAIIGFTDLLEKNIDNSDKRYDYISKIKSSNSFLLSLINNVLEMARIESGKIDFEEEIFNAYDFNDTLYSIFSESMAKKGIKFTRSIDIKHSVIKIDGTKLREIFLNLLSNAMKYTPSEGKVSMSLTELASDREGYALYKTVIEDTGIGMHKDFVSHVFDEFSRERTTTESKVEGSGLGMSIVKNLIDLMDGTIEIESEVGKGTKITVIIPHKICSEDEVEQKIRYEESADSADFTGKRILLAEDNDLNAEIAQSVLEDLGFTIDRAKDGVECVKLLEDAEFDYYDLILMDIQMPNMNGYEATLKIRSLSDMDKASIPVIAMTANAFEEDRREAVKKGMNAHIAKPLDIKEIVSVISKVIAEKK